MAGWLYILIALGVGVGLALYVDRLKSRPGSGVGETPRMGERSRWLHFWYTGRFPDGEGTPPDDRDERK